jgi:hypothetical protein
MTIEATEARPDWRQVNIHLLAGKLYAAHAASNLHNVEFTLDRCSPHIIEAWERAAEAAVQELIDRPNREFQAQLDALLTTEAPRLSDLRMPREVIVRADLISSGGVVLKSRYGTTGHVDPSLATDAELAFRDGECIWDSRRDSPAAREWTVATAGDWL